MYIYAIVTILKRVVIIYLAEQSSIDLQSINLIYGRFKCAMQQMLLHCWPANLALRILLTTLMKSYLQTILGEEERWYETYL